MGGKGPSQGFNIDNLDPAQRQVFESILGSDLESLFDPQRQADFFKAQVGDPMRKEFQEVTLPNINEQFIGQGAASSSGLNRAVTQAGSDLQGKLASSLSQFQQQGQSNQLALLQQALGMNAITPTVDPGKPGMAGNIFGTLGTVAGGVAGGPTGAAIGGAAGRTFGGF